MSEHVELPAFATNAINLASPRLGAKAVYATDEFFAPKERMLEDSPAVFLADEYDDNGKWMDGWESRRRRNSGHDYCVIKLGVKARIRGVDMDTSHFTGNYPPAAYLEACLSDSDPDFDDDAQWTEIIPAETLGPDAHHYIECKDGNTYNYLRLHILPDGGMARLRVYGEPQGSWVEGGADKEHELSAVKNGGRIVGYNNAHYGEPWRILTEGRGINMGDGWETRRRRRPGNDWIIIKLGAPGYVDRIEVDTAHFKGNYPDKCSLQAALVKSGTDQSVITQSMFWEQMMAPSKLEADTQHFFAGDVIELKTPVNYLRLNIHTDGGISRFRVFGRLVTK
ncbi:MAG: allantoicase [Rhodospirillales bacterium]|nr:allantoicase [Rhodospirillales bacterium]